MTPAAARRAPISPDLTIRLGVAILLTLLLFLALLLMAPLKPGAVRVLGVGLAWWYGGVLAPLLAVLTTAVCLGRSENPRDE